MTPDQLDKARAEEAWRIWTVTPGNTAAEPAHIAARLAREGWTPPDPISPRVMAAREWMKGAPCRFSAAHSDAGDYDTGRVAKAFLAGFAAAVKLAEPLAEPLVELIDAASLYASVPSTFPKALTTYRQSIGESHEGQ